MSGIKSFNLLDSSWFSNLKIRNLAGLLKKKYHKHEENFTNDECSTDVYACKRPSNMLRGGAFCK